MPGASAKQYDSLNVPMANLKEAREKKLRPCPHYSCPMKKHVRPHLIYFCLYLFQKRFSSWLRLPMKCTSLALACTLQLANASWCGCHLCFFVLFLIMQFIIFQKRPAVCLRIAAMKWSFTRFAWNNTLNYKRQSDQTTSTTSNLYVPGF